MVADLYVLLRLLALKYVVSDKVAGVELECRFSGGKLELDTRFRCIGDHRLSERQAGSINDIVRMDYIRMVVAFGSSQLVDSSANFSTRLVALNSYRVSLYRFCVSCLNKLLAENCM